jgi:hypothetical protein
LATAIAAAHPGAKVESVPGAKSDFIVTVDNKEVWNKMTHPEHRFPEHGEILSQLRANA